MYLSTTAGIFGLRWGEFCRKWGVNRIVAQIHALLFITAKPMNAEQIVDTLGVARSNVSNSIKELQSLNLVQTTHILGDRRDYFTTNSDVWTLARVIVEERYKRELAPTVQFLDELMNTPEFELENEGVKQRIKDTHGFVDTLTTWANEMLKLSTTTLNKILKLGATVQKFLK